MRQLTRRSFIKHTVGAIAATTSLPVIGAPEANAVSATTVRPLGKSGLSCSLLGVGTGTRGREGTTDQTRMPREELVNLLEYAYQQGITYFDLADRYGSHGHMKDALAKAIPRDKVMLLSKVWNREPDVMRADIERFRKEVHTDYLDVVLMHCLRTGEENWPDTLKASMDVLSEAKAKGHIRAHGVSCHNLQALQRVADTAWVDVVLARINPFGANMDGPVEEVVAALQKIHEAGKGVLGMKILGEGNPEVVAKMNESIKFVIGLGSVDAMTIGVMNAKELDGIMGAIKEVGSA
ncbi:MAG: aldo/keto reductase [Candidatus Hydrogenedentes bacterium]|nr:aldo/keto reductase [Candidatus Hydrogenedentota bacterium]